MPPVQRGDGIRTVSGHAGPVLCMEVPELRGDRGPRRGQEPRAGRKEAEKAGDGVKILIHKRQICLRFPSVDSIRSSVLRFPPAFYSPFEGGYGCANRTILFCGSATETAPGSSESDAMASWQESPRLRSCSSPLRIFSTIIAR